MGAMASQMTHDCLLNRSFMRRSKKTSKLRVPVNSLPKGPVTRKMFPFDEVIVYYVNDPLWCFHINMVHGGWLGPDAY